MTACRADESNRFIQYALYPLLLLGMCAYAVFALSGPPDTLGRGYGVYLVALVAVLLAVETLHPLRAEWRMTSASFLRRDLPYMLAGGATLGIANYAAGLAILHFGIARGQSHLGMSLLPAVLLALLLPDFLWYWIHRWSHEARGPLGRWLWRMHVAHHLPEQVYLLMHAVGHPINTIIVRIILTVPLFALGVPAEALFVANLVVGLQGFVSHFNVDIRAGWLNYLLVGTELHRYHHSADPGEGRNFAAVVSIWDLLFGTFQYKPGQAPARLGVADPARYPRDRQLLQVFALPLRGERSSQAP